MSLSNQRLLGAIQIVAPSCIPSQLVNLALLIRAILLKRPLCLSELAHAYPTPIPRRLPHPKHDGRRAPGKMRAIDPHQPGARVCWLLCSCPIRRCCN